MSQHYIETTYNGKNIEVLMGWDRPLSGFFMVIFDKDIPEDVNESYIYNNLEDPDIKCVCTDLDYFGFKLGELGIDLPAEIFTALMHDRVNDIGNSISCYKIVGGKLITV